MLFHALSVCVYARLRPVPTFQPVGRSSRNCIMSFVLSEDTLNTALLNPLRPVITCVTGECMGRNTL